MRKVLKYGAAAGVTALYAAASHRIWTGKSPDPQIAIPRRNLAAIAGSLVAATWIATLL